MFGNSLIHDESKYSIEKGKGTEECTPGIASFPGPRTASTGSCVRAWERGYSRNISLYILIPIDPTQYFVTFCIYTTSDIKAGLETRLFYII